LVVFSLSFKADRIRTFCSDISEISSGLIFDLREVLSRPVISLSSSLIFFAKRFVSFFLRCFSFFLDFLICFDFFFFSSLSDVELLESLSTFSLSSPIDI
jgi:hypothetical protein